MTSKHFNLKASLIVSAMLLFSGAQAQTMSKADVKAGKAQIAVEKCDAMAGDAKSSCVSSAKVKFGKS